MGGSVLLLRCGCVSVSRWPRERRRGRHGLRPARRDVLDVGRLVVAARGRRGARVVGGASCSVTLDAVRCARAGRSSIDMAPGAYRCSFGRCLRPRTVGGGVTARYLAGGRCGSSASVAVGLGGMCSGFHRRPRSARSLALSRRSRSARGIGSTAYPDLEHVELLGPDLFRRVGAVSRLGSEYLHSTSIGWPRFEASWPTARRAGHPKLWVWDNLQCVPTQKFQCVPTLFRVR